MRAKLSNPTFIFETRHCKVRESRLAGVAERYLYLFNSPGGIELEPFELKTGDIVEFGFEVVGGEDNRTST